MKIWSCLGCGLLALGLSGCQDYGFEELPSSVIREKRFNQTISVSSEVDILFVVDNSGSMVGEQQQLAQSFSDFADVLDEKFGQDKYHIAIVTTGVYSNPGCQECGGGRISSCINDTGETGRFQDRRGRIVDPNTNPPTFEFITDPSCKIIDSSAKKTCFYNEADQSGTVLVGVNGCGYEKGLEPVRLALSPSSENGHADTSNAGFLRDDATLAIVVVSDEDDCGKVGEVTEDIYGTGAHVCYYAAKGIGPANTYSHPQDPASKPYTLTPVEEYYDFLMGLKDNREGMVKFAAIVGIEDIDDLSTTTIEYTNPTDPSSDIEYACQTPGCTGDISCYAYPGTRYIRLAQKFGIGRNGFLDTLCQERFSDTMEKLGTFVACPDHFNLTEKILDPGLANILINDEPVPRYSCTTNQTGAEVQECRPNDNTCPSGSNCVETWWFIPPEDLDPPDPNAPGGVIRFAEHYDPCELIEVGEVHIELVYVTE
ncbi:MAG: VWA domain-containing protein [Deltaproteobacteria bacterium]|nr:VWA domain-containing protein [Deltaproteobacteria bacterium]